MGQPRMFLVCELQTGNVVAEFPFTVDGELTRLLQAYGTGTLSLNVTDPRCPGTWEQDFLPWRNLVLVCDEDQNILWHGVPTSRQRDDPSKVTYPCATLEAYLLKRYVPDFSRVKVDQAIIARDFAALCADATGIPLQYDTPLTGVTRERNYFDEDNARVYTRLQELGAVQRGFDWTVDVAWADDDRTRVTYTFRTGYPHLGYRTDEPEVVFDMPGNMTAYDYTEAWDESNAATHVTVLGDTLRDEETDTEITPISESVIDTDRESTGWPRIEDRRKISGGVSQATLQSHAHAIAGQLFGGQNLLTFTAREGTGRGSDLALISLGDSVRAVIDVPALKLDVVWVVTGWAVTASSNTYKPTIARLGR